MDDILRTARGGLKKTRKMRSLSEVDLPRDQETLVDLMEEHLTEKFEDLALEVFKKENLDPSQVPLLYRLHIQDLLRSLSKALVIIVEDARHNS